MVKRIYHTYSNTLLYRNGICDALLCYEYFDNMTLGGIRVRGFILKVQGLPLNAL